MERSLVTGEQALFLRKTNKLDKPVGGPVLNGYRRCSTDGGPKCAEAMVTSGLQLVTGGVTDIEDRKSTV